ncbi:DUF4097 family beta strand repeat-containing protein [Cytobacillus praedii]|uniref:DUF4097 family beta strand repeat-containing protein n=1 Tax=Cytobacillus praedii TaxID=1742358 RepID=UPI00070E35A3|nr:DUF4097 family beta strand repeat-containing protein [Cytobacillus praedii]
MRKIGLIIFVILLINFLSACMSEKENEDLQKTSLKDIDTILIDFGSTNVNIVSAEIEQLELSMLLHDDGPSIAIDKEKHKVIIQQKKELIRLFKIGKKPQLEVRIPIEFTGKIILDGSSGDVFGENLQTHNIRVDGSSGKVELGFSQFKSNINVKTTSGNINIYLNEDEPDARIHLKSSSGRHAVGLALENFQQSRKETRGTTGNANYEIKLETSSGNISIN